MERSMGFRILHAALDSPCGLSGFYILQGLGKEHNIHVTGPTWPANPRHFRWGSDSGPTGINWANRKPAPASGVPQARRWPPPNSRPRQPATAGLSRAGCNVGGGGGAGG